MTIKFIPTATAKKIGESLRINWQDFNIDQFRRGMRVELEHSARDPQTNVTKDNLLTTGKIALAHLKEFPDYYDRLAKMEEKAKQYWRKK